MKEVILEKGELKKTSNYFESKFLVLRKVLCQRTVSFYIPNRE